jgi:MOSC domain-containing protein YiiM
VIVERIFISPERGAAQVECERIALRVGLGIVGDRNFGITKHPGQNLTLVEAEEIERFCAEQARLADLSLTRRNLITRGVRLNDLVNSEFTIGNVKLRGVELCEPCVILGSALSSESLATPTVIKRWVGRGGLRVDVLSDGKIVCGAQVELASGRIQRTRASRAADAQS